MNYILTWKYTQKRVVSNKIAAHRPKKLMEYLCVPDKLARA
jgi:hypothetical protein